LLVLLVLGLVLALTLPVLLLRLTVLRLLLLRRLIEE
jgi:hypothetical protein